MVKMRRYPTGALAKPVLPARAERDSIIETNRKQTEPRSRLIEDLILREHRTVTLSDNVYELLSNSAEALATNPERLAEELVNCCCAILARQTSEPVKPVPWWMFWHRRGAGPLS